ncbi:hypothetical protein LINGRAHAP2_LOCUS9522 [Linum grandiflorum]
MFGETWGGRDVIFMEEWDVASNDLELQQAIIYSANGCTRCDEVSETWEMALCFRGDLARQRCRGAALLEALLSWLELEGYEKVLFETNAQEVVRAIQATRGDDTEFGEFIRGVCSLG